MPNRPILLGVVGRPHGVRGLVRVTSHTADPADLTGYGTLSDPSGRQFTLHWVGEGIAAISEVLGGKTVKVTDRATAERLTNTRLFIARDRLPAPEPDEYYIADLIGLTAIGADEVKLGFVSAVHDYGAGASVEIDRGDAGSLLVPFTAECVPHVNIEAGRVTVAPPEEIDVPAGGSVDGPAAGTPRHHPPPTCSGDRPGDPARHYATPDPRDKRGDDDEVEAAA